MIRIWFDVCFAESRYLHWRSEMGVEGADRPGRLSARGGKNGDDRGTSGISQLLGRQNCSPSRASISHTTPLEMSDVVLESGSVLESDSSTYFEDSDSDSDSSPLDSDSDSNPRTRLDSRCSGIGLSTV